MKADNSKSSALESVVAESIANVASELRLLEVSDVIAMIKTSQNRNIGDLVNSSCELYFRPGYIRYAYCADCCVQWDATPAVAFYLEFIHPTVRIFFRLLLGRHRASIEIIHDDYRDSVDLDDEKRVKIVREAMASVRLQTPSRPGRLATPS